MHTSMFFKIITSDLNIFVFVDIEQSNTSANKHSIFKIKFSQEISSKCYQLSSLSF